MADLSIAMTGHRPKDIDGDYTMSSPIWLWIADEIKDLFKKSQPKEVISGMALGIDTQAAMIALEMDIPLIAAVPFKGQEKNWPQGSQSLYNQILEQAAEVHVISSDDYYASHFFQKRNEWMVDRGDLVCAVWGGSRGGTNNCVEYALKQHKPVWRIDFNKKVVGWFNGIETIPKRDLAETAVSS